MTYPIDELIVKDDSLVEQERVRAILSTLKEKEDHGEYLSEHEKDFYCCGLRLSKADDGNFKNHVCCSNYKFKMMYHYYFHDLSGNGFYKKIQNTSYYIPDRKEIQKDIKYLSNEALNWERKVKITTHSESLLQMISKETREDLKNIDKRREGLFFRQEKIKYQIERRSILLHSKYIYCMALQIFEMFDRKEFILFLNGEEIEINEFSIIHILNRHYSQIVKPSSDKTFHVEDFEPKYLNKQLKEIFEEIDKSKLLDKSPINNILFKYKGIDYSVWINKRTKQIKGKGNVVFNRLETFYPLTEKTEVDTLLNDYAFKELNSYLGVYYKSADLDK